MFQLTFVVHAKAKEDEELYIVGNIPALGEWDPVRGLRLVKYEDDEYQSQSSIDVPGDRKFEFKIIKLVPECSVVWEELPNNANRKCKPRHHSRLILTWSNHIGNILNKSKSTYSVNGMPGVIMGNVKETGVLKRKSKFDPHKQATNNDSSSSSNENDSFSSVCERKKSHDIRVSISKQDVDQIYYEPTEIYRQCMNDKKKKVYLIGTSESKNQFDRLEQEVEQLRESDQMQIKWMYFNKQEGVGVRTVEVALRQIDRQDCYLIFVDILSAIRTRTPENVSACLYLSANKYQEVIANVEKLKFLNFICFDQPQQNKMLFDFFQKQQQSIPPENQHKFEEVSLNKVIQQLHFSRLPSKSLNTIHTFTKNDALHKILCDNSILIIDSSLIDKDKEFFDELISNKESQKRLIIIVCLQKKEPMWISNFRDRHDVCVIFNNFENLYLFGKVFWPLKTHQENIDFLKYKANFYADEYGGTFTLNERSLIFRLKDDVDNCKDSGEGSEKADMGILNKIVDETKLLLNDLNYFKISLKGRRFKLLWALAPKIRLIRTVCRIKSIEEGRIGKIFLISCENDFNRLKKQIKIMIKLDNFLFKGAETNIYDFGYGDKATTNFKIGKDVSKQQTGI